MRTTEIKKQKKDGSIKTKMQIIENINEYSTIYTSCGDTEYYGSKAVAEYIALYERDKKQKAIDLITKHYSSPHKELAIADIEDADRIIAERLLKKIYLKRSVPIIIWAYHNLPTEIINLMKEIVKEEMYNELDFDEGVRICYQEYFDNYQQFYIDNLGTAMYNFISGIIYN